MTKYYLLTEQDLDEIIWDVEYLVWKLTDKIKDKFDKDFYEGDPKDKEEEDNY